MRICGLGWRAEGALHDADGETVVLAALSASVYVRAGEEILWIGGPEATPHARAIHVADSTAALARLETGDRLRLPRVSALAAWRPNGAPTTMTGARALRTAAARLTVRLHELGEPRGFGAWLLGAPMAFPLDGAGAHADALAHACAADDAAGAAAAASALVGLGPGLTPAGDDLIGGAFFARALLVRAGARDAARWDVAAASVKTAATRLTHPIGATLLGDLLAGEGWAPLHDLAAALASADERSALDAARRLTGLGHSSGWDLLAGFVAGARG
jgi:Protein of unknown function (DUF2877)